MNIIGKFQVWKNKRRHIAMWKKSYRLELRRAKIYLLDCAVKNKDKQRMYPDIKRAMALIEACIIMGTRVSLNNEDGLTIYLQENMSLKNYMSAIKWLKKHKKEERQKYLYYV